MKQSTQHKQKYFGRWWNYTNIREELHLMDKASALTNTKASNVEGISMQYKNKTQPKVRPCLFLSKA